MGIPEEIFEGFFKKLKEDENFPDLIVDELRGLWEFGEIASQEKIFKVIERGCEDASEDKED